MNTLAIILFALLFIANTGITLVMCAALALGLVDWFKSIIRNAPHF